jgi:DNA-binding HxlR family transcriptional regulator
MTPWDLVSFIVALNPNDQKWEPLIVNDMKQRVGRFGEIMVDPSIAQ